MFTEVYLGWEALVTNSLGEKSKGIVYSDASLFCKEKSVKRAEFYQAMATGLTPEKVISMNRYEYKELTNGKLKKFAKVVDSYNGDVIEYTIIREYEVDSDNIELTLKRGVENVHA